MKHIIVAALGCFYSITSLAQLDSSLPPGFVTVQKTVICGPATTIFKSLAEKEINEKPIWIGVDENKTNYAVFVNAETGGFTMLHFGEKIACIIGMGPVSDTYENKSSKSQKLNKL